MPTVSFTITADQAARLQLATYLTRPDLFPDGAPVILNRTTNAVLLASDGSGVNLLQATDAQLTSLINNGKPANDTPASQMTRQYWAERIATGKQSIENYRKANATSPLSDTME